MRVQAKDGSKRIITQRERERKRVRERVERETELLDTKYTKTREMNNELSVMKDSYIYIYIYSLR